jgi:hypothetical protein
MATIIRRFNITLSESSTEASMAPVEHFFVVPKGMQCRLVMEKIEQ